MTYKAKDRVVDRDGAVWQYNALYGTFRCVSDEHGVVFFSDFYSPDALRKKFGPLTPYEIPKHTRLRFNVEIDTVVGPLAWEPDYIKTCLEKSADKSTAIKVEVQPERRKGVAERRIRHSRPCAANHARVLFSNGRRKDDKPWWGVADTGVDF